MTGDELHDIRRRLKLSIVMFGRALGYGGDDKNINRTVRRYESNEKEIPPWIARLAIMFDRYGVPTDFLADEKSAE